MPKRSPATASRRARSGPAAANRPGKSGVAERLEAHGIQPTAQRVAVAEFVLGTDRHPAAETVLREVRSRLPYVSRATVYNTLRLFVERGLLRQLVLAEGHTVFDPRTEPHHHFIDEETGEILDIPWEALAVEHTDRLPGLDVREYQVVLRGRRRPDRRG